MDSVKQKKNLTSPLIRQQRLYTREGKQAYLHP